MMIILVGLGFSLDIATKMKYWSTTYVLGFLIGCLIGLATFGIEWTLFLLVLIAAYILIGRSLRDIEW